MVAANFTGGQAEELRRALGFKRSKERMVSIEQKLRAGMQANGIGGHAQEVIVQSITSFALYGFPESHAASFALLAYASAYLKSSPPCSIHLRALKQSADGFLSSRSPDQRRSAAWLARAAHRYHALRMEMHPRKF